MNTIVIKNATCMDVPILLNFIKELADYEKLSSEVIATEKAITETLFGEQCYAEALIAHKGNQAAGFALFFHTYSTFLAQPGLHLEDLYVKPQWRNQGIAKQLLIHLAQLAKQRKCGRIEWSVLKWNKSAIKFYQRINALPLDQWMTFRLANEALDKLAQQK
ncbi:MAG: GNAT family N-acetyltransferase [Gammaproteobacteria bacterium]